MKILFISLGCDKNLVDAEVMLGLLTSRGYTMTDSEEEANIIVVNTCCFISDAKDESVEQILEMAKYKQDGNLKALLVTGCMAQKYKADIMTEIPEVDAVLGTTSYEQILDVLDAILEKTDAPRVIIKDENLMPETSKRMLTTGGHYAYLKIAEGCDKHCTYCMIPQVRGNFRSVPLEKLLEQANDLVDQGVKELILVAQETTLYGVDLYGDKMLPKLLRELAKIPMLRWIRVLYCYPEEITDELIETFATEPKVLNYIDMPIQHASDEILKRMGRHTTKAELTALITKLHTRIPDICIRTTLIVGFPGETESHFEELMEFVDEMEFDRLGVFPYSREDDTPAASMANQVDEEIKSKRQEEVMLLQQEIAFEKAEEMVGQELLVMIEGNVADEPVYVGRTYRDTPNIDGLIFIHANATLVSGDFVMARVTGAREYDLIGGLVDELTE